MRSPVILPPVPETGEVAVPDNPIPIEPAGLATPQEVNTADRSPLIKNRLLMYRFDVGMRKYSGAWDPIDDPLVLAAGITHEPDYWPLGIEAGFTFSTVDDDKDGSGYRSSNYAVNFGGSKTFWPVDDKLLWTFGGGLAINYLDERYDIFTPPSTTTGQSGSDWWLAAYLHTRLAWKVSDTFDIGLDLGGMTGQSVSTIGPVRSSENGQLLLSFGFHR